MSKPLLLHAAQGGGVFVIAEVPGRGIVHACGDTVPSDATPGFAPGCLFVQIDGATEATIWYANVGTKASCNFDAVDLNVAEAAYLSGITLGTGAASKVLALDSSGDVTMPDNGSVGFGGVGKISWDTSDANANELLIQLPAGGATDVPVVVIGDTLEGDDLGLFNGVVSTTVAIMGSTATATGPSLHLRKSRGTNSAPTVVTSGDDMGSIDFYGAVAADEYVRGARILAEMTGTIATTRGPGVLTFQTATDAAPSVLTTAMTISAAQLVTCAAGLTVTTGDATLTAGSAVLGEATLPAGTNCYIGRDNTGDTNINALTGKTVNLQVNGTDIATLSATVLSFTGTIAATGARVTQSYHTNITSTNAVTVDSSETVKDGIEQYDGDAVAILKGMDVITYRHKADLDPSGALKLGIRAESVSEPLAVDRIGEGEASYPGVNLYSLLTLTTRAIQQLCDRMAALEAKAFA